MNANHASLLRGTLMGWLAALFCVGVGFAELSGANVSFFSHPATANLAMVYGMASVMLLLLCWHYRLRGRAGERFRRISRNLSIVYVIAMIVVEFSTGGAPEIDQIFRLLLRLGLAWLVYSSMLFIVRFQPQQ